MEVFDTHKFLFTLFHEGRIEGHTIIFLDRDNNEKKIEVKSIDIGASPVSCKLYDNEGKKHLVPFIRVQKVFYKDELVWDNTDVDTSNVKVIKGYD